MKRARASGVEGGEGQDNEIHDLFDCGTEKIRTPNWERSPACASSTTAVIRLIWFTDTRVN
jgi:hypothetical protein